MKAVNEAVSGAHLYTYNFSASASATLWRRVSSLEFRHISNNVVSKRRLQSCGAMTNLIGFNFSKRTNKRAVDAVAVQEKAEDPLREEVVGISENELQSAATSVPVPKPVIPNLPNTFQVGLGKKTLYLPEQEEMPSTEDRFEMANDVGIAQADSVTYGLNKRNRPEKTTIHDRREMAQMAGRSERGSEKAQFKAECAALPEQSNEETYEAMPIEMFGEAMLRGMGWEEGKSLSKYTKARKLEAPVAYVPRPRGLGLGATPQAPPEPTGRRIPKSGEPKAKLDLVLPSGPEGQVRHVRSLDEKLVQRVKPGTAPGKIMILIRGQHCGMKVKVLKVEQPEGRSERATVEMRNGIVLQVRSSECADLGTPQAELALSEHSNKPSTQHEKKPLHAHNQEGVAKEEAPWLMPHIRVKMISKSKEGGALYLKKCEIVDVTASRRCSVVLDSGRIIGDVTQRQLETSLPKPGGRVIVVLGENRGERGKLIERNSETGTVQLNNDFSLHKLPLDCIAEYCGAHDDED